LLNELADLHRCLIAGGIELAPQHPWIKPLKNAPALAVFVESRGSVGRVAQLSAEDAVRRMKIEKSNHASFPAFNLKCPLSSAVVGLSLPAERARDFFGESGDLAYDESDIARVDRILHTFGVDELGPILKGRAELAAMQALIDRMSLCRGPDATRAFVRDIGGRVLAALAAGDVALEFGLGVLFGQWNKKRQTREAWDCTLLLEVADAERFSHIVMDPMAPRFWSEALLDRDNSGGCGTPIQCALTGRSDTAAGEKLPNPNLRLLGLTYLMSMNRDSPCQTRYGLGGSDVFRVGSRSAQEMNSAILHATTESRRFRTWTSIPNGPHRKSDLLIAYLEEDPDGEALLVGLFSDEEMSAEQLQSTYEARTANILASITQRRGTPADCHVRVFALSALDKGRKQVVHSARYSVAALTAGRDRWVAGARNLPLIGLPFRAGRGMQIEWQSPGCPSPSEAMRCFATSWGHDGSSAGDVPGVDLRRIFDLYLAQDPAIQARWLLARLVPQVEGLLMAVGACLSSSRGLNEAAKSEALRVVALIGILLFAAGRRKDEYMESREFLIGRFLQLADQLHKAYCKEERGGGIPPQLVGNAALTMALDRPSRAIEMLTSRMGVYLAWADRYKGDNAGLVRWFRRELGDVALELRGQRLDERVATSGRAELLLGYLASLKQSEGEGEKK